MRKIKSSSRIVFIFPNFVLKFSRIYISDAMRFLVFLLKSRKTLKTFDSKNDKIGQRILARYLFGGILTNWHEYLFYQKNKSQNYLVPSYFSFFGLLNIQKRGIMFNVSEKEFWNIIINIPEQEKEIWCDEHTFSNPKNFCHFGDFKVRILDYGDVKIQGFLKKYGEKIYANINL